jgi:ligand-binding sensor domain-containing protein/signal transduction histidine kinase
MVKQFFFACFPVLVFSYILTTTGFSQDLADYPLCRQIRIQTWNLDAEVPPNIYVITQAPDNFLWLGSDKGAYRFDGIAFEAVDADSSVLGNECHSICFLQDQSVLCGFSKGKLVRYHEGKGSVISSGQHFGESIVSAICEDPSGTVWIGTAGAGLFLFQAGIVSPFAVTDGIPAHNITSLVAGKNGEIWAGTQEGLCRITGRAISQYTRREGLSHDYILSILLDSKERLWIGTHGGLNLFAEGTCRRIGNVLLSAEADIQALTEDAQGNIWFASFGEGVYRFHPEVTHLERITDRDGLPSNLISCLYSDKESNVWLGFQGNFGLSQLQKPVIQTITDADGLSGNNILPIYPASGGRVWLGTATGGLDLYTGGRFTHHGTSAGLGNNPVFTIAEDASGNLWVGSLGKLVVYDGSAVSRKYQRMSLGNDLFHTLFRASDGTMWAGTEKGIYIFRNQEISTLTRANGLSGEQIFCFAEDREGNIWIGTQEGGITIYTQGGIEQITEKEGLSDEMVLCFMEDSEGIMWAGTATGGLNRIDRRAGRIHTFGEKNGLDNTISQILEDSYGYLWLGTGRGIMTIEKKQFQDQINGALQKLDPQVFYSSEANQVISLNAGIFPANCRFPDGTLWFPTNHGIAVIHPELMHGKVDFPRLILQEVDVNHTIQPLQTSYVFPPSVIHLEIRFTAPTFIASDQIQFRYRLMGYDDEWIYPKRRTAYFTKIPYGSYRFEVQASNRLGQWNDQVLRIPMHIKPFFYESVWFMILCALVGIFLIYATVRYRIRQIREKELEVLVEKRTAELKQLNRELDQRVFDRTAELAASNQELEAFSYSVSHDLRAPVRRIEGLIQAVIEDFASQMNQAGKDFLEKIRESTGEMNQLIEEFLKLARIARQELDKTELDMSRLAAEVTDDLARTDPGRKVMVNIHPGLKAMGDTRLIRIVLQNLLGNAWKYTGKNPSAEIEFACRKDHHQAIFFIRDNGVGFDMNHYDKLFAPFMRLHSDDQFTGTGIGLATVKRIIVKHGGKIWAQSEPGKGSTFYFTF